VTAVRALETWADPREPDPRIRLSILAWQH
jgi:hypothetical protein